MKLPESAAFALFDKHGLAHPKFASSSGPLKSPLNFSSNRLVVKANLPAGGKKKSGLLEICQFDQIDKSIKSVLEKSTKELPFDSVIVEEFIDHEHEYFVALKAVREGIEVYYSGMGGIDVEQNWEKVEKVLIPTELLVISPDSDRDVVGLFVESKFFNIVAEKVVREWVVKLIQFFQEEDASYLEINPFTVVQGKVVPLGVVLVLDEVAEFRHKDWVFDDKTSRTEREKRVSEVDSEIKGSIKLVEVPGGGNTAILPGGAGAALFLCDAIVEAGFTLANYAEFSGNPPDFAVAELTKQVCAIPGIKNLVIGSGIANFTSVVGNFKGIIEGLRASPQAKGLNIVVRRCGPGEQEGMEMMKKFAQESGFKIQVFGRETGMTEIVK